MIALTFALGLPAGVVRRGSGRGGMVGRSQMKRKPTIYEALVTKLGRAPTNAEIRADVERIKREVLIEMASAGKLRQQRRRYHA